MTILYPMFGMIALSSAVVLLLYGSRFFLIARVVSAGGRLGGARHSDDMRPKLPTLFRNITDNYNHIFEQPTLFFAVLVYIHLMEHSDSLHINLAWGYVAARLIHSVTQITVNHVPTRIVFFVISGGCLITMIVREMMFFL